MRTMHLFAGAGGGILADLILGHTPVVAVEWEPYPCQVLRERVADGWFPNMQVHEGDVRLFDSSEYQGRVDCIHAGFPCQDISNAGNQAGVGEGTRSGLYREVLRISDEIRPRYIFLENVAAVVTGDDGAMLRTVVGDLAERGFDAVWCRLAASQVGARHKRDRWWLLAFPSQQRCDSGRSDRQERHIQDNEKWQHQETQQKWHERKSRPGKACAVLPVTASQSGDVSANHRENREPQTPELRSGGGSANVPDMQGTGFEGSAKRQKEIKPWRRNTRVRKCKSNRNEAQSDMGGMADALANQLDIHDWVQEEAQVGRTTNETENRANRLKALGNGQVPLQAATAFSMLWQMMESQQ